MSCNFPWLRRIQLPYVHYVSTPCGYCSGCKAERVSTWSDRCMFEVITNERPSCMLTLTYNDEHLPPDRGVRYEDVRGFNLRFRKNLKRPYRYFFSSEYGESDNMRPHYHALLFGFDCQDHDDMQALYNAWAPNGDEIGFFTVDYVTAGRIRYVLKYISKESGKEAERYASAGLPPLFHCMSKGIGKQWFLDHLEECQRNHGYYVNGRLRRLPRYYEDILSTFVDDDVKFNRSLASKRMIASKLLDKTGCYVDLNNSESLARAGSLDSVNQMLANPVREVEMQHRELLRQSAKRY